MAVELERAFVRIEADIGDLQRDLRRMDRSLAQSSRQASRRFDGLNRRLQATGNHFRTARRLAIAFGIAVGLRKVVQASDTYVLMADRLKLVSDSQEEASRTLDRLFNLSQETRNEFEATVTLYTRTARATKNLDLSQRDLLTSTGAVLQAIRVSGATASEATGGIRQLSQALQSNVLSGDELRSVRENLGRLFIAIIEGIQAVNPELGLTSENLKKLATQGKLTSELIVAALINQAPKIQKEYDAVRRTIGQAMTQLGNSFDRVIGKGNETADITSSVAEAIDEIREVVDSDDFATGMEFFLEFLTDLAFVAAETVRHIGAEIEALRELRDEIERFTGLKSKTQIVIDLSKVPDEEPVSGIGEFTKFDFSKGDGKETKEAKKIREMIEALGRQAEQARFMAEATRIGEDAVKDLSVAIEVQEALIDSGLIPGTTGLAAAMDMAADSASGKANAIGNLIEEIDAYNREIEAAEDAQDKFNDMIDDAATEVEDVLADAFQRAADVIDQAKTPLERYLERIQELVDLLPALEALTGDAALAQEAFNSAVADAGDELILMDENLRRIVFAAEDVGFALGNAFERATLGGEGLLDVLKNLAREISSIGIRSFFTDPLSDFLGGQAGSLFGPSGIEAIAAADVSNPFLADIFHGGGVVGSTPVSSRVVPADIFANAPRFHFGGDVGRMPNLRPNERAIITEVGERITPAGQSGGGTTINVGGIHVNAARGMTTSQAHNIGQQAAAGFKAALRAHTRNN